VSLFLSAVIGYGQTSLATVTGTVTDGTGAVISNAPIVLRNLENGETFKAASSETGNYTVSQVPIGDYDLTITVTGFKTYTHTKFHLAAAQTMREDVTLEVGATTDAVTVTAEASLLRTESSELAHNVTLSQMNNLPLLNIGVTNQGFRDPYSATRLAPGIRYAQAGPLNTMVINGTSANSVQGRLDGQTQNPTSDRLLGATGETQASVDAIEEVAVLTSNFAAEYGTAGGAIINMVTKSGTNQFHGGGYDYMRNEALDAHQPYTGLRNKVRQNDWGFTFGGPVKIPKVYDGTNKTFFFWSWEQYRNTQLITTGATTVPIPAYRNGDFTNLLTAENRLVTTATGNYVDPLGRTIQSGSIFDPATTRTITCPASGSTCTPGTPVLVRDTFANNQIQPSRFNPVSLKILGYVPLPNGVNADKGQVGSNYQVPYDVSRVSQIPSIKIDQNIGAKNRVSIYYQHNKSQAPRTPTGADNFPDLITASNTSLQAAETARLNWDYTATPRLLLHFGAGWNLTDFKLGSPVENYDAMKDLGLRQSIPRNFPVFVTGNSGTALGGMSNLGTSAQEKYFERRPAGNVSASYVVGSHTFKAGAEYRLEKFPDYSYANSAGTYGFGSGYTTQTALQGITTNQGFAGFAFSSFLLGGFSSMSMAYPTSASPSKSQSSFYVQDNWKVTRKLTLDYGLRWDYGTYAREQYGRYSSFDTAIPNPSASGRPGARKYEAVCGCNLASNYHYAWGPRLGAAYQMDRKTVIRAGFGIIYDATATASGGFVNTATANSPAFGQIIGLISNGTPAEVAPIWPNFDPGAGQAPGAVIAQPTYLDRHAGRPPRLMQWNFTVQREINRDLVVEAAYVANRAVWVEANALSTYNLLSEKVVRGYGFNDFTSTSDARLLTQNYTNLSAAEQSTLASRGITALPYSNFPNSTQIVRQSLIPFPQYTGQTVSGAPMGNSWYDAFQLTVNKRFSHGLTFNVNYTWSKNLELTGATDPFNRQNGKNLAAFDLPRQLRMTIQYQIPQTKNLDVPVLSNKVVSYIVSDWGLGWYATYQSAGLVGRATSSGTLPISQFLGRGPGGAQLNTDGFSDYANPWSVDWTDYDGKHHTDPINVNCHCFDPTKTIVLNPKVWSNVPNGQFAADQSSIRWFRGIRFPTESANLSRNFRMGKEGRVSLNVRVEFQNIFNRTQYPAIALGNFATTPTKFTSGANTGLYSGGFGTINPTAGTAGQRTGTFIARVSF
jgi:hypothetical protein